MFFFLREFLPGSKYQERIALYQDSVMVVV